MLRQTRLSTARFVAVLLLFFVFTPLTSQPARAAETVHLWITEIPEIDAFLAVAEEDGRITAYVCNGTPVRTTVWGWFHGGAGEAAGGLVSGNGLLLQLDLTAEAGTLTLPDGTLLDFDLATASPDAGFWRYQAVVEGEAVLAGWIIQPDGRVRGALLKAGVLGDFMELDKAVSHEIVSPRD